MCETSKNLLLSEIIGIFLEKCLYTTDHESGPNLSSNIGMKLDQIKNKYPPTKAIRKLNRTLGHKKFLDYLSGVLCSISHAVAYLMR